MRSRRCCGDEIGWNDVRLGFGLRLTADIGIKQSSSVPQGIYIK